MVDKTKLMLNSTQVEDVVEVGVELGNFYLVCIIQDGGLYNILRILSK